MDLTLRCDILNNKFFEKDKKFIHYYSLKNFVIHLDELSKINEYEVGYNLLNNYITILENLELDVLEKESATFFVDYIYPIGKVYKKIGFREILRLKNQLFFTIHLDFILWILFFDFFIPFFSILILGKHFFLLFSNKDSSKKFGILF